MAVPVTPNDLSATGKETCLAHERVAKKKGGGLSLQGVKRARPHTRKAVDSPEKEETFGVSTVVNKKSLPNMNWR
jgi:hypothetical protein